MRTDMSDIDRSWINLPRISDEYAKGVEAFLQFAQRNICATVDGGKIRCPCVNCLNGRKLNVDKIREHLICDGFLKNYTTWTWHGELIDLRSNEDEYFEQPHAYEDANMDDRLEDMIRDVGVQSFAQAHAYEEMSNDAETPLYPGCTNFTRLSAVLRLVNLKAINGWTDKSFTELLVLVKEMLPEGNTLPNRNYEAKKVLCPMGMEYKRYMHAQMIAYYTEKSLKI